MRSILTKSIFFQDFGVKSGGAGCVFLRIILGCIRYMKQQSHSFESARKACASLCQLPLQNGVRPCNIVLTLEKRLQIHVNVCKHSPTIAGFLQCNGGKLEEAEGFKCVCVIYCVF